tara:strand:+ start:440 stop:676 length:237 start_codon:yes stop_codon:yes gene_type:complete
MSEPLRKLVHVGTDVLEREIIRVVIPGHSPIRAEVIGVYDGMVFVEKDDGEMSWVNAEFIYNTAGIPTSDGFDCILHE